MSARKIFSDRDLMDLVEDRNNGELGNIAALLSDARERIRRLEEDLEAATLRLHDTERRWQPILATELFVGDIFKIDGNPVRVTAIEHGVGNGRYSHIKNDRYTTQVWPPVYMVEAWR